MSAPSLHSSSLSLRLQSFQSKCSIQFAHSVSHFTVEFDSPTYYALCTALALAPLVEPPLLQSQQATTRRRRQREGVAFFALLPLLFVYQMFLARIVFPLDETPKAFFAALHCVTQSNLLCVSARRGTTERNETERNCVALCCTALVALHRLASPRPARLLCSAPSDQRTVHSRHEAHGD